MCEVVCDDERHIDDSIYQTTSHMYFVFLFINIVMMKGTLMTVFIRLLHTCILFSHHHNVNKQENKIHV
jgi:hypothetical protein